MKTFESLDEFFSYLNEKTQYVVLRNFESFRDSNFLTDHPDVDLLCEDREQMLSLDAFEGRGAEGDHVHVRASIAGEMVPVDLRTVGDGYYCKAWEKDILTRRVLHDGAFYVMNEEDYFYSLLYHVLVQKNKVSEDYKLRLPKMGKAYGLATWDQETAKELICKFLREKKYEFSYPESSATIFNVKGMPGDLIERNAGRKWKRMIHGCLRVLKGK